jgi:hypothetical protein
MHLIKCISTDDLDWQAKSLKARLDTETIDVSSAILLKNSFWAAVGRPG